MKATVQRQASTNGRGRSSPELAVTHPPTPPSAWDSLKYPRAPTSACEAQNQSMILWKGKHSWTLTTNVVRGQQDTTVSRPLPCTQPRFKSAPYVTPKAMSGVTRVQSKSNPLAMPVRPQNKVKNALAAGGRQATGTRSEHLTPGWRQRSGKFAHQGINKH